MLDRRTSPLPLRLDKNLAALGEHSARLAERIAWTTLDATVDLGMENTSVRLHQAEHALVIGQAELTRAVSAMPEADEVFVFGIGLGEQLAHFLLMRPETRVTAWERDPALLRQALSERDFTRFLSGGRTCGNCQCPGLCVFWWLLFTQTRKKCIFGEEFLRRAPNSAPYCSSYGWYSASMRPPLLGPISRRPLVSMWCTCAQERPVTPRRFAREATARSASGKPPFLPSPTPS